MGSLLEHVRANAAAMPISSESEVKTLLDLRERLGLNLMAATNLAYLLFHAVDDAAPQAGRMAAGYPPLRRKTDNIAIWKGIDAGLVDAIATGSSAADDSLYGNPIFALPALYAQGVLANRVSIATLVSALCDNPAKMLSLYPRKGTLQIGADADIVLFELDGSTTAPEGSPYADVAMAGRVRAVIRRGEFAAVDGEVQAPAGSGIELKPEAAEVSK
jgi:dihydropyrimidinase